MLAAIGCIAAYIDGMDLALFQCDRKTLDAVRCNLQVIGEASHYVPSGIQARIDIPWADLRDLRNEAAHRYFVRDPAPIWKTITQTLPAVSAAIQDFLNRNPDLP